MANAKDAHQILKSFAFDDLKRVDNAGIAISVELFRRLSEMSFATIAGQASDLISNTTFPVGGKSLDLSFDATIDSSHVQVFIDKIVDSGTKSAVPVLRVFNVGVALAVYLHPLGAPKVRVAAINIAFDEIATAILLEDLNLFLTVLNTRQTGKVERFWETDSTLEQQLRTIGFSDQSFKDLTELLQAIRLIIPDELAKAYVDSFDVPDLFSLFPGIVFEGHARIGADGDFLLLSADTRLNFAQCPIAPVDGTIATEASPGGNVSVSDKSVAKEYPKDALGNDFSNEFTSVGSVFLYAPKKLFEVNFEGVAKPAVGFAESGRRGIIAWGYSASLMLQRFSLSLTGHALEFLISISLNAVGYGSAGVKIGSVYWRVAGIAFRGDIDPVEVLFRIALDFPRKEIVLISRIARAEAHNFDFMVGVPFPLNRIAEFLLERAATKSVRDQAGKILATTRIPIGRLAELERVATLANALAIYEDPAKDSVTFGASLSL